MEHPTTTTAAENSPKTTIETNNFHEVLKHFDAEGRIIDHETRFAVQCAICIERNLSLLNDRFDTKSRATHEPYTVLPCGHAFGYECVSNWALHREMPTCPLCRKAIYARAGQRSTFKIFGAGTSEEQHEEVVEVRRFLDRVGQADEVAEPEEAMFSADGLEGLFANARANGPFPRVVARPGGFREGRARRRATLLEAAQPEAVDGTNPVPLEGLSLEDPSDAETVVRLAREARASSAASIAMEQTRAAYRRAVAENREDSSGAETVARLERASRQARVIYDEAEAAYDATYNTASRAARIAYDEFNADHRENFSPLEDPSGAPAPGPGPGPLPRDPTQEARDEFARRDDQYITRLSQSEAGSRFWDHWDSDDSDDSDDEDDDDEEDHANGVWVPNVITDPTARRWTGHALLRESMLRGVRNEVIRAQEAVNEIYPPIPGLDMGVTWTDPPTPGLNYLEFLAYQEEEWLEEAQREVDEGRLEIEEGPSVAERIVWAASHRSGALHTMGQAQAAYRRAQAGYPSGVSGAAPIHAAPSIPRQLCAPHKQAWSRLETPTTKLKPPTRQPGE
ncbi:Uu.00g033410.m01.CDS01 [Anthostomella pinea]|uniref:Uu.00g033410.m01.CDS01 n=1 Tax=Anthostomella pinea TaxID=933095 RepID=A0AAI8V8X8_9PEZI|nr:Uu.00g033410.m01.CDS01 [Anthostomella pinea]